MFSLEFQAKELKGICKALSFCHAAKPDIAVIENILVEASEGKITFTTFDLVNAITVNKEIENTTVGKYLIPYTLFNKIVQKLEGVVTLELESEHCYVTNNGNKFTLQTQAVEDYPNLLEVNETAIILPGAEFAEALNRVLICASDEMSKQILTGICVTTDGKTLELAATDSHRLAVTSFECSVTFPQFVISKSQAKAIARLAREADDLVISRQDNQVKFEFGNVTLVGSTLLGAYPKYGQLIPTRFNHSIKLDSNELIENLELVSLVDRNTPPRFKFAGSDLTIWTETQAGEAKTSQTTTGIEGTFEIAFNHEYLIDLKHILNQGEISLGMNAWNAPVILRDNGSTTYLVMPVQVRK